MIFLDPTTDLAFKKIFCNQAKKSILIGFLNSILGRVEGNLITNVIITDPHNHRKNATDKSSIVDASCVDQEGNKYILEMQVVDNKDYLERCQYYVAEAIAKQLVSGDAYVQLKPVIFIGVLCFKTFESREYLSHHLIADSITNQQTLKHLAFHFIELPKFEKTLSDVKTDADRWVYLLKNAQELTTIPKELSYPASVQEALGELERGMWSSEELDAYDSLIDSERVRRCQELTAIEKGQAKGRKEGLKEGIKEGIKEGLREGLKQASITMALKLIAKQNSVADIAALTELAPEEIKALIKAKNVAVKKT